MSCEYQPSASIGWCGPCDGWPRIGARVRHGFGVDGAPVAARHARARARGTRRSRRCARGGPGRGRASSGASDRPDARVGDRGADALGALGDLGRIDHAALVVERLARVVLPVRVRGEREHRVAVARRPRRPEAPVPAGTLDGVPPLDVSVWTVDLDQPLAVVDALRAHLDDDRGARGREPPRTTRCATATSSRTARCATILGARLGVAPGAVVFDRRCARCGDPEPRQARGRDRRDRRRSGCEFSLSHSESVAVIAVVTGARVGVDIEVERPRRRLDALAARVLASEDHADWLDLPASRAAARVPRAVDREGGVPQGDRRGHHRAAARRAGRARRLDGDRLRVAAGHGRAASRSRATRWCTSRSGRRRWSMRPGRTDSSRPIDKFRDTAVGSVLAAGLLGLRDALEPPKKEEVAIVQDYAGEPPFTDPFVLRLDPEHPEDSIVMVRPVAARRRRRAGRPPSRRLHRARSALAELARSGRARRYEGRCARARCVQRASTSGSGVTPRPGPVGTARRPASSSNGSVRSSSKYRFDADRSPVTVKPGQRRQRDQRGAPDAGLEHPARRAATPAATHASCVARAASSPPTSAVLMLTTAHACSAIASRDPAALVIVSSRPIGVRSCSARRAWSSSASGASGCSRQATSNGSSAAQPVRVVERVAAVGVDLDRDVVADRAAHRGDHVDVVARRDLQLQAPVALARRTRPRSGDQLVRCCRRGPIATPASTCVAAPPR